MATLCLNCKDKFRMIVSVTVSHLVKICRVLTILHLTHKSVGAANFGTWCKHDIVKQGH